LKVIVTIRFAVKLFTVHCCPFTASQPPQLPNVDPAFGVAVTVTFVPLAKLRLQGFDVHVKFNGTVVMLPEPAPAKVTVRTGVPEPEPPPLLPKQTTFAVMLPVTIAPDEDLPPALLFVVTVAVMREFPQAKPVAVIRPAELTVTTCGLLEAQVTWFVMSFVTGG
jgi:hypothetical protein